MFRGHTGEVLIAGAGPVGTLTALALAEQGVKVDLIDEAERSTRRRYACLLHPRSLKILAELGLEEAVLALGRKVDALLFYEGASRRAELKFSELPGGFRFVLVLPQNEFEQALRERLAKEFGITIQWEHRLADLEENDNHVVAAIERFTETAKGYPIATWQRVVQATMRSKCAFLVGADGPGSHVRQLLNIGHEHASNMEYFDVFEFESASEGDTEIRVVFHEGTVNVLWPLRGNRRRWSFQTITDVEQEDISPRERFRFRVVDPEGQDAALAELKHLIQQRAPWFDEPIEAVHWVTTMDFEPRVVERYGAKHCWLAGDAAHTGSPVGMQSMNLGFCEAMELAGIIAANLHGNGSPDRLERYGADSRNESRQLLGIDGGPVPTDGVAPWVAAHSAQLLSCIPASGADLAHLLAQLGLDLHPVTHLAAR